MIQIRRSIIYPEIDITQHKEGLLLVTSITTRIRIRKRRTSIYYFVDVLKTKVGKDSLIETMKEFQREITLIQNLYVITNLKRVDGNPVNERDPSKEDEIHRIERLYIQL